MLRRFCKIHRYKQGEDHRLYKSNKHFEKVKWNNGELTNREKIYFYQSRQPNHHTYQYNSCKYISKKTKRKRENTHYFAYTMKPSNNNANTFFDEIFTMKVKCKMPNIPEKTTKTNHDKMREENHYCSHSKCCIDISIDRSEIVMESWEECENPIQEETIEISAKNIDKYASYKPESFVQREMVAKKWLKERFHMLHYQETSCMDKSRLAFSCRKKKSSTESYDKHKYPGRKYRICHSR